MNSTVERKSVEKKIQRLPHDFRTELCALIFTKTTVTKLMPKQMNVE